MGFFLLLFYVIAYYLRPGEQLTWLAEYRIMIWLMPIALVGSLLALFIGERPTFRAPQIYLMVALIAAISASQVAQGWLGGAFVAIEDFAISGITFFLVVFNVVTLRRLKILAIVLIVVAFVMVTQGVLAYHFGYGGVTFLYRETLDYPAATSEPGEPTPPGVETGLERFSPDGRPLFVRIRALGLLNDPNELAEAIVSVLPFIALAWRTNRRFWNFFLVLLPISFLLYGVYLTKSRGGVLSLLALSVVAFRRRLGRKGAVIIAIALFIVMVGLNFSGGRSFSPDEGSAHGRLDAWSAGLTMFKSSPLFGVGYGEFLSYYKYKTAHNSFVLCFAELGLVGYFLWLALLIVTFVEIIPLTRPSAEEPFDNELRRWARAVALSLVAFLVGAFFLSRTYVAILYLLIGMAAAVLDVARKAEKPIRRLSLVGWATRIAAVEVGSIAVVYVAANLRGISK